MNWTILKDEAGLQIIKEQSALSPQVIYKHSTRCGISSMIRSRLERSDASREIGFHFLDLIAYRSLSNKIAADFFVEHESPQVLVIRNGECVYDESHNGISMEDIIAVSNQ